MKAAGIQIERLAVLGLGLLGGSVAMAARKRGVARAISAASRSREPLEYALQEGMVDSIGSIEEAVRGADFLVLASPVEAMPALVRAAAPHLQDGALMTDLGSTKGMLAEQIPCLLPPGVSFVGAHPMAGSHDRGLAHARADLFEGACCVVTPADDAPRAAADSVSRFWEALGARVVVRSPRDHDAQVAWISHLPHLLAFAFAEALRGAPAPALELAGSGFADFTRIARSDPGLWSGIFGSNHEALAGPLRRFGEVLESMACAMEEGDTEVQERMLASARAILLEMDLERADPGALCGTRPIRG